MSTIPFDILQEACRHSGWIKDDIVMCSYKNGVIAKCWDEWQPCNPANCFLINRKKKEEFNNQQSIFDFVDKHETS